MVGRIWKVNLGNDCDLGGEIKENGGDCIGMIEIVWEFWNIFLVFGN